MTELLRVALRGRLVRGRLAPHGGVDREQAPVQAESTHPVFTVDSIPTGSATTTDPLLRRQHRRRPLAARAHLNLTGHRFLTPAPIPTLVIIGKGK
jgi:hypothetical protein